MTEQSMPSPAPQAFGSTTRGRSSKDYADRYFAGRVKTADGQEFNLAMVADSFGEGGLAGSVAQLALNTVIEYLRHAPLTDIPDMLRRGIEIANKRVCEVARRQKNLPLSTTLAAAAIYKNRLYIANVGNSRVYLVRAGQASLLTIDHTVAFEQIVSGRLNADQALHRPDAQQLARSIGFDPKGIKVDLGLYLQGGGESAEQARQQQGIELQRDDLVLVCSDGLIKPLAGKGPLASRDEIRKIMENLPAQQAAQELGNLAAQRNSEQDVTAIILEMPGRHVRPGKVPALPLQRPTASQAASTTGAQVKPAQPSRRATAWILGAIFIGLLLIGLLTGLIFIGMPLLTANDTETSTQHPTDTDTPSSTPTSTSTLVDGAAVTFTSTATPSLTATSTFTPQPSLTRTATLPVFQPNPTRTPTKTPEATSTSTTTTFPTPAPATLTPTSFFFFSGTPTMTQPVIPPNLPSNTPRPSRTPLPTPNFPQITITFPAFPTP